MLSWGWGAERTPSLCRWEGFTGATVFPPGLTPNLAGRICGAEAGGRPCVCALLASAPAQFCSPLEPAVAGRGRQLQSGGLQLQSGGLQLPSCLSQRPPPHPRLERTLSPRGLAAMPYPPWRLSSKPRGPLSLGVLCPVPEERWSGFGRRRVGGGEPQALGGLQARGLS